MAPTRKQKLAVNKIVENRGNVSKSMREAGYDDTTAKNPKNLTESKGYRQLLEEYGLTEDSLIKALVEDINKKPQNRIRELTLGADLLGMRKAAVLEVTQQTNAIQIGIYGHELEGLSNEELERIVNGVS